MLINRVEETATPEEISKLRELEEKARAKDSIEEWEKASAEANRLHTELIRKYVKAYCSTEADTLKEVHLVIDAITKEDYLEYISERKADLYQFQESRERVLKNAKDEDERQQAKKGLEEEGIEEWLEECSTVGVESAYIFLGNQTAFQHYGNITEKKLNATLRKRAEELCKEEDKNEAISISYPPYKTEMLTRLNTQIFRNRKGWDNNQVYIDVTPNKLKKKGKDTYKVSLALDPKITSDIQLTPKDEGILSSAVSLAYDNEHGIVTPHEVAKYFYYGNEGYSNPSPQQVSAIKKKLDLYANNRIEIDYTEHAKLNGKKLEEGERLAISRYIYPCDIIRVKANGKTAEGYRLIAKPPLFEYAEAVNQLAEIPSKALNVPVQRNDENVNIREYLLKQIAHLKGNASWGKTYTFDKIFEEAGIEIKNRQTRKRKVDTVKKMLEYWKGIKYIQDFSVTLGAHKSPYSITFIT